MGFKLKAPKIKISAPKIKLGDPTKLVTKAVEGLQNASGSIAQNAVGNVGKVLATPGAGELIQGVGTGFGIPLPGGLGASAFVDRKGPTETQSAPMPQTQNFQAPSNKMYYIIAAVIAVFGIVLIIIKRK